MKTTIKVERNETHIRLIFEEARDDDNTTLSRHWDLGVVQALQVATSLTKEVAILIHRLSQKGKRDEVPSVEAPTGDAPETPAPEG